MSELLSSLNWLSVIVATIVYFVLGALWYSVLFGKIWMKLRNLTEEDIGNPNPIIYLYSLILQFIAVVSLALFITALGVNTAGSGAFIGFGVGAGFILTLAGSTGIFTDLPMKLHFLDNGYHVVGLILAGLILGWW